MSENKMEIEDDISATYKDEVLKIYEEHPFVLGDPDDYILPENAIERYKLLKAATGKYHYWDCWEQYEKRALKEGKLFALQAQLKELEQITLYRRNKTESARNQLFLDAKNYLEDVLDVTTNRTYTIEEATLYMYILHEFDHFEAKYIPQAAFGYCSDNKHIQLIAEVYGKYYLFYDFLKPREGEIKASFKDLETNDLLPSESKAEIFRSHMFPAKKAEVDNKVKAPTVSDLKKQTLKDIWETDSLKYYDAVMNKLLTLEIENALCVSMKGGEYYWSKDIGKGVKLYLAAFFYECVKANLLDPSKHFGSLPIIRNVLENTFNISSTSDPYTTLKTTKKGEYDCYRKPFRALIKEVKGGE